MIGLKTKHADCRITFKLFRISSIQNKQYTFITLSRNVLILWCYHAKGYHLSGFDRNRDIHFMALEQNQFCIIVVVVYILDVLSKTLFLFTREAKGHQLQVETYA